MGLNWKKKSKKEKIEIKYRIEKIESYRDHVAVSVRIFDPRIERLGLHLHIGDFNLSSPSIKYIPLYVGDTCNNEETYRNLPVKLEKPYIKLPKSVENDKESWLDLLKMIREETEKWLEKEYLPNFTDEYLNDLAKLVKWASYEFPRKVDGPKKVGGKIEYSIFHVYPKQPNAEVEVHFEWEKRRFEPVKEKILMDVEFPISKTGLKYLMEKIDRKVEEFKQDIEKNPPMKYETGVIEIGLD